MDDIGPELSPERQETVAERFTQAVEYEVAFFDAVYGA
jgi:thiaminase